MKILLLNQFFWPDSAATSQLLTDLAIALAEQGHQVSAVCADGGYALSSSGEAPAVRVHRIKTMPFSRRMVGRVLSYCSFYLAASFRSLTLERQDLVITLTTPPLLPFLGTLLKLFRGSRHFIWEMDVYPDVAIDLSYFRSGGVADRVVGAVSDLSRRRADGIIALGECMKDRLIARGIVSDRIFIAENWADSANIQPLPKSAGPGHLTVLYSGNLGLAHDVDTIAGSMLTLREDSRFKFLFVGGGSRRAELSDFCEHNAISFVTFAPYVQRDTLSESLAAGDIGLVTQRDACCGSVVPSKVYGLLAAGRPILFIGPKAATPARIIDRYGCGWQIDCGDIESLTTLLRQLAAEPKLVIDAGKLARQTLLEHYDRPLGVARIAGIIGARPVAPTLLDRDGSARKISNRSTAVVRT